MTNSIPSPLQKSHRAWLDAGEMGRAVTLRERSVFDFGAHGEVLLGFPIDWVVGQPGNDNLSWQLHSLAFLRDVLYAHELSCDSWWANYARDIVLQWSAENLGNTPASKFSWNDHGSAYRLTTLCNIHTYFSGLSGYVEFLEHLTMLVARHQQVLASESFYSRGTNHGLYQSYALYQSSYFFQAVESSGLIREVARDRLVYEVRRSFSNDGVHIENSPQYHETIMDSILQINETVFKIEGLSLIPDFNEFARDALNYLSYVIRPDGMLPPIGDSLLVKPRHDFKVLKQHPSYPAYEFALTQGRAGKDIEEWHKVFPASGYAVFRGDPEYFQPADRPHLIYKCGFLSHYHRQDDDNNFLLFALGEEWLTDGGLYVHDHDVPEREYLRSHRAHNVAAPQGGIAERIVPPIPRPHISGFRTDSYDAWVSGETTIFSGYLCAREINYDGLCSIVINDRMVGACDVEDTCFQYWQIPQEHIVCLKSNGFIARSILTGNMMVVEFESASLVSVDIVNGLDGVLGVRSKIYGVLEPVSVVCARYRDIGQVVSRTRLNLIQSS